MAKQTDTLRDLARTVPAASRVFHRYRLDFCCGGARPLGDVCAERGLDADTLLAQIESESRQQVDGFTRWDERSPGELVQHILETYHAPLRPEIARLRDMALKVESVRRTAGGLELALATDPRIGTGRVTGVEGRNILTDTRFYVGGFRYYHGARLTNAAGSAEYFAADVVNKKYAQIDPAANPLVDGAKLAAEFPVGSWFEIYDYGVGDAVAWPAVTEASLAAAKPAK